ncbi:MAG: CoA-binding protein [Patescibacteria group bacterium]
MITRFLNKENIFAVVGASDDHDKYGYKVFKKLKNKGYEVFPVNPNCEEILGQKTYNTIKDLPKKPDVVETVVPPKVTERIAKQCKEMGIKKVWMQPGSESKKAIDFCHQNNIEVIHNKCVIELS